MRVLDHDPRDRRVQCVDLAICDQGLQRLGQAANIGGIDEVLPIPKQTIGYDRFVYDENNLPFDLPLLDNRTKARYLKTMPHRYLQGYDFYIWLDGRVEVTSKFFIAELINKMKGKEFVCTLHPERDNCYDELKHILHEMNKGNHYLIERYGKQNLRRELDLLYKMDFPKDFPLFASGIFIRANEISTNLTCNDWFLKCLEYTNFDQVMLAFQLWANECKFNTIPYENEFYRVLKHKPINLY